MVHDRIYLTKAEYKIAKYIYKKEPTAVQLMGKFHLDEAGLEQLLHRIDEIITISEPLLGQDEVRKIYLNERGLVAYEEKHERDSIRHLAWSALWIAVGISTAALAVSIVAIALH